MEWPILVLGVILTHVIRPGVGRRGSRANGWSLIGEGLWQRQVRANGSSEICGRGASSKELGPLEHMVSARLGATGAA